MAFLGGDGRTGVRVGEEGTPQPSLLGRDGALWQTVAAYVMARLCKAGGFCFYRLEEPNGADTYYALSILRLLSVPFSHHPTVRFLQGMQRQDGAYESIYAAFYALKGLECLGERPLFPAEPYIYRAVAAHRIDVEMLPAEITSLFRRMSLLIELYGEIRGNSGDFDETLIKSVLKFHNEDGGFGYPRSTVTDTAYALGILRRLAYPVEDLGAATFLRSCEIPRFGFTDIPGSTLSYLEYIYAGVKALACLGLKPLFPEACWEFIMGCRKRNDGFSRARHGGIATLEDTYYAVSGLCRLEKMRKGWVAKDHCS
ncbi:MAG: hypothetical protein N2Z74_00345 [Syntrophales bacterium]|nr:hypothetical protein [Syntrophales bacterium]